MVRQKKKRRSIRTGRFGPQALAAARFLVSNYLVSRSLMPYGNSTSQIDQTDLDIDKECRYPLNPDVHLYRSLYDREGIAQRVNDVYPDECWSIYPELYQTERARRTEFEIAWDDMTEEHDPWHYLHRIDRLSGLGRYGVLMLGFDDGRDPDRPLKGMRRNGTVNGSPNNRLLWMHPYSEDLITISKFEEDKSNPRYSLPRTYKIKLLDPRALANETATTFNPARFTELEVHWSRVIHVADNLMSLRWAGQPRMQPVVNRIYDLRKILGSSAEMFFKGGFPGYTFAANDNITNGDELDDDSIKEQLEDYMNGLKRYLASTGGEFKALLNQVADPTNHIEQQIAYICATLGVPFRILMGSEAAHLASTQDAGTWNRRLARRQKMYLNPKVIKPFVNRMMMVGALPRIKNYKIEWRDLNSMTDTEKSKVALTKAQAMMQYVSGKVETMMPVREFFTLVLGMTPAEADAVLVSRMSTGKFMTERAWQTTPARPQGGGRTGNAPAKAVGRRSGS